MFEQEQGEDPREHVVGGGLTGTVRKILDSASGFLATKLELISIELQEEKRRVLEILLLAALAILFGVLTLIILSFTIVVIFWEHRIPVLIGMSIAYLIGSVLLFQLVRAKASLSAKIFQTSIDELKKDSQWLNRHL
jgi:uncharacterized membrane protein YqjE